MRMGGVRLWAAVALLVLLIGRGLCAFGEASRDSFGSEYANADSKGLKIRVGAERTEVYVPHLLGRCVGLVCNHTSMVRGRRLVDTLMMLGVNVVILFTPEHGMSGRADAGEAVRDGKDQSTRVPIVSLYGKSKKPTAAHLSGVDVVVFDMQDVGVRCYTYASTMHYMMEACAEFGVPFMLLDRPNPNGYFVDGPLLQEEYRSFIGMHPIPWVHGMTLGELAQMVNGEGWLKNGVRCALEVVPCEHYSRGQHYEVDVAPSPNLPTSRSILLYPTLALLEGTTLSVGRGTDWPFEVAGSPYLEERSFSFIPRPRRGAIHPPYEGKTCYGIGLMALSDSVIYAERGILLYVLQRLYAMRGGGHKFFTPLFDRLVGTPLLRRQLEQEVSADSIRLGWQKDIERFKKRRAPYLLYE